MFYAYGHDAWQDNEYYYEGAFAIFSSLVITVMGVGLLRIGHLREKWRTKLAVALQDPVKAGHGQPWLKRILEKYAMFTLPFITVLREGIEAIVFVAGVSFSAPVTSIPLAVLAGLALGAAVGYFIYR